MASIVPPQAGIQSGAGRLSAILACVVAVVSAGAVFWLLGDPLIGGAFLAGLLGLGAFLALTGRSRAAVAPSEQAGVDVALLRAAMEGVDSAVAITDAHGAPVCANRAFAERFGAQTRPDAAAQDSGEAAALVRLRDAAIRDGGAQSAHFPASGFVAEVEGAGIGGGYLVWRFASLAEDDLVRQVMRLIAGDGGHRLGAAGIGAAVVDGEGKVVMANGLFAQRSGKPAPALAGQPIMDLVATGEDGALRFAGEGRAGAPLHAIQVAATDHADGASLFLLLDDPSGGIGRLGREETASINALVDFLPLGLALVNVDGRILFMNKAFRKAAGLGKDARLVYPSDLVVDEDKAALSDSVRRFARGPATTSGISLRLKARPDDPVPFTVAGIRGLGDAAVILAVKDSSEEDRLKHQVAQATKMQAVGQLAGGVAHDFNNILTAIIGHCDLMLMRHTPGDSDYDDIQQIRSNSNRAAGLTRQLLAFSRQQTLRPQVLQLPDVISEVSNLLKRLLGETVKLQVKHGRNLGAVRADPGQLEQVIVNLAVNARDAMPDGGVLTLQTFSCGADEVRKLGVDFLPIGDYTGLKVTDTGTGIPPKVLPKIFEPFFTTKEVGKGTGLGLSTVYGIVKQSGGYIFAESEVGSGTSFLIYFPVNRAEPAAAPKTRAKEGAGELWGTGTILLVEDEAMVRAVAERALTRHGYTVLTAENGEAALEILARENGVDLMISDVVMPTMDGPTTAREARKSLPDLPILFISGYAEEQLRKSIDLERVAFLAKPFSIQKLAEATRDALAAK